MIDKPRVEGAFDPSTPPDARRDDLIGQAQHDDHIWLTIDGEGWAIYRIDGPLFTLWRGFAPELEFLRVDLSHMDWTAYSNAAKSWLR